MRYKVHLEVIFYYTTLLDLKTFPTVRLSKQELIAYPRITGFYRQRLQVHLIPRAAPIPLPTLVPVTCHSLNAHG
jgi:hypothetical protein